MAIQVLTPPPTTLQQPVLYEDSSGEMYLLGAVQLASNQVDESQGNNLFKYNIVADSWTQLATEPRYTGDSVNGTVPPGPIQSMGFAQDTTRSGASNLLYRV